MAAFAFVGVSEGDAFVMSILFGLLGVLVSLPGGLIWMTSGHKRGDVVQKLPVNEQNRHI